jgi:hypothetical protein
LHSRTGASLPAIKAGIKIISGNAIVKVNGKITENLYFTTIFEPQIKDNGYYDNPAVREGTTTKNETKYLRTGEEYTVPVLPAEVVVFNIISSDDNDVEIIVYQPGKKKNYTVSGKNRLGVSIAFQNR